MDRPKAEPTYVSAPYPVLNYGDQELAKHQPLTIIATSAVRALPLPHPKLSANEVLPESRGDPCDEVGAHAGCGTCMAEWDGWITRGRCVV